MIAYKVKPEISKQFEEVNKMRTLNVLYLAYQQLSVYINN